MTTTSPRLFFTSVPKAGKNLVYSFLAAVGFQRHGLRREPAIHFCEQPWFGSSRCTYALPAPEPGEAERLPQEWKRFLAGLDDFPAGQAHHHHFPFHAGLASALDARGVPKALLIRDPRDILVSMADYLLVQAKPAHLAARFAGLERPALIERLFTGDDVLVPFCDYLASFEGWRRDPGTLTLRFEDLVGARGGGDDSWQSAAFTRLARHAGMEENPALVQHGAERAFNPKAGTFFRSRIGRWREEGQSSVQAVLSAPDLRAWVGRWGYEGVRR